jgi:hypothetical protein
MRSTLVAPTGRTGAKTEAAVDDIVLWSGAGKRRKKEEAASIQGEKKQLDCWLWRMVSTPKITKE